MTNTEFYDDPVAVTATIDQFGNTKPTAISWQGRSQRLVTVGRQWNTENGRHILVEASDGIRYELLLSRADLIWRLKRAWPLEMAA